MADAGVVDQSAAPGTEDEAGSEKKKIERIHYIKEGAPRLETSDKPDDFDRRKHFPLNRNSFAKEYLWLEFKAKGYEQKAKEFFAHAEMSKKLGDSEQRSKAKRLARAMSAVEQLREDLLKSGDLSENEMLEMIEALNG